MQTRLGLILLTALVTACATGAGPSPTPLPSPIPTPLPSPTPNPSPSPTGAGFYLRAWYTQALPPIHTFSWLPPVTIDHGVVLDGNVAVPAIYPGPLLIGPVARAISDAGIAAIIDEARRLGLLGDTTDFTGGGAMPGARLGQLRIVVDGRTYDLTGNPDAVVRCDGARCQADAGSPAAFAAFWQELTQLEGWIGNELGQSVEYRPDRVALVFTAPATGDPMLQQQPVTWPLATPMTEIGVAYPGQDTTRCVTLKGSDLDALLPLLQSANQLTVFVDGQDNQASVMVAVVVPGADSPCPDEN